MQERRCPWDPRDHLPTQRKFKVEGRTGTSHTPQSCHELHPRGRAKTDQLPLSPGAPPLPGLGPFKNHSFVLKEEQKYSNKSNKELLVL